LFADDLSEIGITSKHYGTLLIVKENPSITQIEAAKIQRVDRTTAGQLVDLLEQKGLLMRSRHPTDRRAYCLQITELGDKVACSLWDSMKKCEDTVLSVFEDDDKALFMKLANKLYEKRTNL
jgi:DNA-binding MarR family transcriptional regulator